MRHRCRSCQRGFNLDSGASILCPYCGGVLVEETGVEETGSDVADRFCRFCGSMTDLTPAAEEVNGVWVSFRVCRTCKLKGRSLHDPAAEEREEDSISAGISYYDILGVPRDATTVAIRKAYRGLAMENHPDRSPGDQDAEQVFVAITRAYETLRDPEKRELYDLESALTRENLDYGDMEWAEEVFDETVGTEEDLDYGDIESAEEVSDETVGTERAQDLFPPDDEVCSFCGSMTDLTPAAEEVNGVWLSYRVCRTCKLKGRSLHDPAADERGEDRISAGWIPECLRPDGWRDLARRLLAVAVIPALILGYFVVTTYYEVTTQKPPTGGTSQPAPAEGIKAFDCPSADILILVRPAAIAGSSMARRAKEEIKDMWTRLELPQAPSGVELLRDEVGIDITRIELLRASGGTEEESWVAAALHSALLSKRDVLRKARRCGELPRVGKHRGIELYRAGDGDLVLAFVTPMVTVLGHRRLVCDGIDRFQAGDTTSPSERFSTALGKAPTNAVFVLAFVPTGEMRANESFAKVTVAESYLIAASLLGETGGCLDVGITITYVDHRVANDGRSTLAAVLDALKRALNPELATPDGLPLKRLLETVRIGASGRDVEARFTITADVVRSIPLLVEKLEAAGSDEGNLLDWQNVEP